VLLVGCSSLQGTGDKGYIAGEGVVTEIPGAKRGAPVELRGESLSGEPLDLADHRGQVVVVNTWWSGCAPCRTEMPMLVEADEQLEAEFVGINIRDASPEQGRAFERNLDVDYPSLYEPGGEALLAFSGKVSLNSIPTTAVLDREGRVAAVISGPIPSKLTLIEVVEDVVAEQRDG
jgi:thiol-disulfide isomerase/thioredoxin